MANPDESLNISATDAIGRRIRAIRERYQMTGAKLAEQMGCGQARISKIENGKLRPSMDFVRTLARILKLPPSEAAELEMLTELFLLEFDRWHLAKEGAAAEIQSRIAAIENSAREIRSLDWGVLSGLLQTREYAASLFTRFREVSPGDASSAVRERLSRQRVLNHAKKRFRFLISEHVFYANVCPKQVMLDQVRFVRQVLRRDNVLVRIVPLCVSLQAVPSTSFDVFDDRLVLIETRDFQVRVSDERAVRGYIDDFELVSRGATESDDETDAILVRIEEFILGKWE